MIAALSSHAAQVTAAIVAGLAVVAIGWLVSTVVQLDRRVTAGEVVAPRVEDRERVAQSLAGIAAQLDAQGARLERIERTLDARSDR